MLIYLQFWLSVMNSSCPIVLKANTNIYLFIACTFFHFLSRFYVSLSVLVMFLLNYLWVCPSQFNKHLVNLFEDISLYVYSCPINFFYICINLWLEAGMCFGIFTQFRGLTTGVSFDLKFLKIYCSHICYSSNLLITYTIKRIVIIM